jgi:protein phosphatase
VLADGMGGYNAGEVASVMAVELITTSVQHGLAADESMLAAQCELTDALHMANTAIYAAAQSTPGCSGMGTTVVAALVLASEVLIAHLGDSRAYAWRAGRLQRLTRDHSLVQQDIDAGRITEADARTSRYGHLVTRALGVMPQVEPSSVTGCCSREIAFCCAPTA